MPEQSIAMRMFLDTFKAAAAEGAAVELKMRLVAGKILALQKRVHEKILGEIESDLIEHFGDVLPDQDRETLRLCRELRNKVLHTDFQAAREKLRELGVETQSGNVVKIDVPVVSMAEVARKIRAAKAGTEGVPVADTQSTAEGSVFGWFLEAGGAGDFEKAANAFRNAAAIIDRLAEVDRH